MTSIDEDRLVDAIYAAAGGEMPWAGMLTRLSDALDAGPVNHTDLDCVSGKGLGIAARTDGDIMHEYFLHWSTTNPLLLVDDADAFRADWRLRILQDDEITDRHALVRSAYYNEFLKPIEAPHSIIIRLALRDTVVTSIAVGRSSRRGRFESAEIARAARLQPHIVRADRLRRRLLLADGRLAQFHAVLERTDQALLFVDRQGRVRACSTAAAALLDDGGSLRFGSGGRLRADDPADAALLSQLLGAAWSGTDLARPDTVELGIGGDAPLGVTANPVRARDLATFGGEPLVLVSLTRIAPAEDAALRLRHAFGLTRAEARVALALAGGDDLRAIGERHGCSVNTVRSQLASVFAKTQCHRQLDLVRMLAAAGYLPGSCT